VTEVLTVLTLRVENALIPDPVPGTAPLILETVKVESEIILEVILDTTKVDAVAVESVAMVLP
jgi:hypothetical protein